MPIASLAQAYQRFAEVDAGSSPLHARVALALSASPEALRALAAAPARSRHPAIVLAALHDLALAGRAPALAAAHTSGDADAAAGAAVDTLLRSPGAVVALTARRPRPTDETGSGAVLYPAVAEVAHRMGAHAVGLIDLGRSAALNLIVDRVGISYDDGRFLGDPSSAVRLSATVRGGRPVPQRPAPPVVARVGVARNPLDVTDADDARWLRAGVAPDHRERAAALAAEIALAATEPPLLLRGDPVELLTDAVARVPAGALPVVLTTWALSRLPAGRRPRLLDRLREAATERPVAWVSVEGVGVAPSVPTFGDRPASGHSIIGLAAFDGSALRVDAVGRCWSRGRTLAWLADD